MTDPSLYDPTTLPERFGVSAERGFLPAEDPLERLPDLFKPWEDAVNMLPKLLVAGRARRVIESLAELPTESLDTPGQLERAMLLLSYLGHVWVYSGEPALDEIPRNIAVPWEAVARRLGRPPVLSYASHALNNWRRFDPSGPIALGNIRRLQNFRSGQDEDWFVLVHVDIEGRSGPGLVASVTAMRAVIDGDDEAVVRDLATVADTLEAMHATLSRMREGCDPYIYYHRVRQFIFGWHSNPAVPEGVRYQGVAAFEGQPQKFRGETGAQSSIIPAFDALLSIDQSKDPMGEHLLALEAYMPRPHRAFVALLREAPDLRAFVEEHKAETPALATEYNRCVRGLRGFRSLHLELAGEYIHAQSQNKKSNPIAAGTGGTPFMKYLEAHRTQLDRYLF